MKWVSVVAVLALIEYVVISLMTGQARSKYGVQAPATVGDPMFERWYRVQHNTLEQIIVFLPALFLFANYVSPGWAALIGLVFIVGRALYASGYIADPASRGTGFLTSFAATVILLIGGLLGALLA